MIMDIITVIAATIFGIIAAVRVVKLGNQFNFHYEKPVENWEEYCRKKYYGVRN